MLIGPDGPLSAGATGASTSIRNVRAAGEASALPAASIARTSKVWMPWLSAAVVCGDVQGAKAAASTRHANVAAGVGAERELRRLS